EQDALLYGRSPNLFRYLWPSRARWDRWHDSAGARRRGISERDIPPRVVRSIEIRNMRIGPQSRARDCSAHRNDRRVAIGARPDVDGQRDILRRSTVELEP